MAGWKEAFDAATGSVAFTADSMGLFIQAIVVIGLLFYLGWSAVNFYAAWIKSSLTLVDAMINTLRVTLIVSAILFIVLQK